MEESERKTLVEAIHHRIVMLREEIQHWEQELRQLDGSAEQGHTVDDGPVLSRRRQKPGHGR